jgi:carbonic anhydrase
VLSFRQLKRMLCAVLQVNFQPGNSVSWGDAQLELLQYHFHTPSEHAWDGQRSAMEAHLVHKNTATGGFSMFGSQCNAAVTRLDMYT